jgi:toxin HigB-1
MKIDVGAVVIRTFKCGDTRRLFVRQFVARFQNIETAARRKLLWLDAAKQLSDLAKPPGNRLEALKADRTGQHIVL